ncbi:hypothetical protein [Microcoleus sp. AR_TQ3_B6]|uniref:hypothetical protein n=1 Tax=Microcoleus sp. AR_TQ3_B6 TaxID=3055284 RepID=UPI002FD2C719
MTYFNIFLISVASQRQFSVKLEDRVFVGSPGRSDRPDAAFPDRAIVPEFTSKTYSPLPIPHYQFPITNSQL